MKATKSNYIKHGLICLLAHAGGNYIELVETNFKDVKGQEVAILDPWDQRELDKVETIEDVLFVEGGYWLIRHDDALGKERIQRKITFKEVQEAWRIFKSNPRFKQCYKDAIEGNDDMVTAEAFMECLLWPETVNTWTTISLMDHEQMIEVRTNSKNFFLFRPNGVNSEIIEADFATEIAAIQKALVILGRGL